MVPKNASKIYGLKWVERRLPEKQARVVQKDRIGAGNVFRLVILGARQATTETKRMPPMDPGERVLKHICALAYNNGLGVIADVESPNTTIDVAASSKGATVLPSSE